MNKLTHKYLAAENKIRESIRYCEINSRLPGERILAEELGISYMTVRKAVENLVAEGVLYKIPKKGTFVANPKTVHNKTKNIGYFLDKSIQEGLTSPYYSLVFNALEKEAAKNGYALLYFSDISDFNSLKNAKKIDGAIVSCFPRIENIIQEMNSVVPVVGIDNSSADKSIPSVTIDNFESVAESVDYLCSLGHKRIGFITGLEDSDVGKNRLAGYVSALKRHGIRKNMHLVYKGNYSFESGTKGADHFLSMDRPPTAIMCANDAMAIGAIREIRRRELNVPDDISVMGFDDIVVASQITPALTTVAAPIGEIAKHSVKMLNSIINGDDTG